MNQHPAFFLRSPWKPLFLAASCLAILSGCPPEDKEDPDVLNSDNTAADAPDWDPGNPSFGCGGYGYGSGPDCVPDGALDCGQDPCIFGTCTVENDTATCICWEGYAGRICGECAQGWIPRGLRCVRFDACEGFPCAFGTCRILNEEPFCDCNTGYTGDHCDLCADGFVIEGLGCVEEE